MSQMVSNGTRGVQMSSEVERQAQDPSSFEYRPGFGLWHYGNVFVLHFNDEFAKRLLNILVDSVKNGKVPSSVVELHKQLTTDDYGGEDDFEICRFGHVYSIMFVREFGEEFYQVLNQFLVTHRISPALFGFIKQLETSLYPSKFNPRGRYADE